VGTDLTVFSFETVRLPNCISGGAIVFSDPKLFEKASIIRDYGVERTYFRDELGEINPDCDVTLPGFGVKPSEVNSYIGVRQLEEISPLLAQQRENAAFWETWMAENYPECRLLNIRSNTNPNYWVFGILTPKKREMILEMRSQGYYASGVHLNNNRYSVFDNTSFLSGVEEFYSKFVALPCGWWFGYKK
jgi:dTDP-4-amino-4,6-dideoxygalactose transaminase